MQGATSATPPAIRRLCLAVDIVSYSTRPRAEQIDVQTRLLWTMVQGCRAAGISPVRCDRQDSGDGQILILPPGIDEARSIPDLIRGLLTALYRVNNPVGPGQRIRLRVSMGQGAIQIGQTGFVAPAVVTVCRLLDSDVLRQAIKSKPASDAALIVTSDLYDDMVGQDYGGLPAADFIQVSIDKPEKGFAARAWLQVPGPQPLLASVPPYPDAADLSGLTAEQQSAARFLDSRGIQAGNNNVQFNHFAGRSRGGSAAVIVAATALAWAVFARPGGPGHDQAPGGAAAAGHGHGGTHDGGTHDGTHDGGIFAGVPDGSGHGQAAGDFHGTGHDASPDGHGTHDPAGHDLLSEDGQHQLDHYDGAFGAGADATAGSADYDGSFADGTGYGDPSDGLASYDPWDHGGASDHAPGHWAGGTY